MTQQKRPNYKWPHSPHHDEQGQDQQNLYADLFYEYEVCHCGTTKTKYRDPNGKKNFDSHAGITGEMYHINQNNDDPVTTEQHPNAWRLFANNTSDHTKGNYEEWNGGIHNHNVTGQSHHTTPKDICFGASNNRVVAAKHIAHIRTKSNDVMASSKNDHIQTSDGESHNYHENAVATTYGNSHYEITKGDFGRHVQDKGNYDVRVEKGKLQIQTGKGELRVKSGSTMVINAASKIEIKVGSSSITIESGKITIKSAQVKFERG